MQTDIRTIIALDIGDKRVGVAKTNSIARLAQPLMTLERDQEDFWEKLELLIRTEIVADIVVGLPRSLNGDETAQTQKTRQFISELEKHCGATIHLQDEALTSQKAEQELHRRKKPFKRPDVDALAATYILEDYLSTGDQ